MNALLTKVVASTFLAVTLGIMLILLPVFVSKHDVAIKTFGEVEPMRGPMENSELPAIITITSMIVPGLIAGFLAFILTKRLGS